MSEEKIYSNYNGVEYIDDKEPLKKSARKEKRKQIQVPIVSNLIRQNCFVREFVEPVKKKKVDISKFESLDEVVREDGTGVDLKYSVEDYAITPEYVNSFSELSDYKKDPLGAIAKAHSRNNLGDITSVQDVLNMSTEESLALYNRLNKIFGKNQVKNEEKPASAPVDEVKKDNE